MKNDHSLPFSPREFMQKRRPERFTDSTVEETGALSRPQLEHYLDTLNTRSQELQFETFSKRLCEKLVCPNLLEQTGPVAGGDGKTDTQTYPVAEQLRVLWFEGINESSHKERWAFAVSTRKDWQNKCKQDVEKIVQTGRGYTKVFCITNRYTKANIRSALEDKLSRDNDIDVRIFDLNWILDGIYKNNLLPLAIETLNIPVMYNREVVLGNNDYRKQKEFETITKRLQNEVNVLSVSSEQVDDFLRLAIISAELEKSQYETSGLFERAINAAKKFGTQQQVLESLYQYSWKAFFWFQDMNIFEENFLKAWNVISTETSATKIEYILNLLTVYKTFIRNNNQLPSKEMSEVEEAIFQKLEDISGDSSRPSNALYASVQTIIYKLQYCETDEELTCHFDALAEMLKKGERLIGFPFEKIFDLMNEVEAAFAENEAFERLMDLMVEIYSRREGEIKSAQLNIKRAIRKYESGHYYQSINLAGRHLSLLYKNETSDLFILGLSLLSSCYEQIGLPWSARSTLLFSASLLTDKYWTSDELTVRQAKAYYDLFWKEIRLGRLLHALQWYELFLICQSRIGEELTPAADQNNADAFVAQLLLNTPFDYLTHLSGLYFSLLRLGLVFSSGVLLFILGYEERLKEEYAIEDADENLESMIRIRDSNYGIQPSGMSHGFSKRIIYRSCIAGCKVTVDFPNRSPYEEFSATLLAILESAFATTLTGKTAIKEPSLDIEIVVDDDDGLAVNYEIQYLKGSVTVIITCSGLEDVVFTAESQDMLHSFHRDLTLKLIPELFFIDDIASLEDIFLNNSGLQRIYYAPATMFLRRNILGDDAENALKNFLKNTSSEELTLLRIKPWDEGYAKEADVNTDEQVTIASGPPPADLLYDETLKHSEISVSELIKPRLWDGAGWSGVGFLMHPQQAPKIIFTFRNSTAGRVIFKDIIDTVGKSDEHRRVRVLFIKGIDKNFPAHYRVVVSESLSNYKNNKRIFAISRRNKMTPDNSKNLDMFEQRFSSSKEADFTCDALIPEYLHPEILNETFGIRIRNIEFRWAWEIGVYDMDRVGISKEDDPELPAGILNPPVIDLLNEIRKEI